MFVIAEPQEIIRNDSTRQAEVFRSLAKPFT